MTTLAVGIIGCGRMGRERARSAAASGARIAAVYDADRPRAVALASEYAGCRVFDSALEIVQFALSAVFVCTPPSARGPVELAAIHSGVPFFVEKPIGVSSIQALAIRDSLVDSGLVHAVGYQNRCRSSVQHARLVLSGRKVLAVSAYWVGRKYLVPWWLRSEDSGGPINEQATHLIDLCRHFCGEIVAATGSLGSAAGDSGDPLSAAIALRFRSGAFGSLFYSCEADDKQIAFRIVTAEGGITLSNWDLVLSQNDIDSTGISSESEDIFVRETAQFLDAVKTGDPSGVACTFSDAWQSQLAVDHIVASNGKWWTAE
jgi:myo-inositol 2-dehydrogenase / D-chiro-inositol 1-dehydrogenase